MSRLVELQIGEEGCVPLLVPDHPYYVGRLDGVNVHRGGFVDQSLVLPGPHTPVDVEGFGTHPSADEHDHGVWYVGGVESCCEPGSEGVPRVESCDCGPVKVGERQLQEVVKVVVSIRLPCGVPEKGMAVSVGDLHADAQFEVTEGGCGVLSSVVS